jgi:hypothetical protein
MYVPMKNNNKSDWILDQNLQVGEKRFKNYTDFHFDLLASWLIRGIHMGEISKLGWLMGLIKQVMWADSLYFLYLLLLSISKTLAWSQPTLWPSS